MTKIMIGDCIEQLRLVPDRIVHCCVTSPPYFGLRDYGHAGQIGHEETPDAYVAKLVEVFREVRRVLRDDGTLWLNLGDSYSSGWNGGGNKKDTNKGSLTVGPKKTAGFQAKQLLGIPWRVAFALQADGWILRQDIIWHKPNPMSESVRDRFCRAHEYIFLFSKLKRYFFDYLAVKEPATYAGKRRGGSTNRYEQNSAGCDSKIYDTRTKRSVWKVAPARRKRGDVKHFAVFPNDLITPCILAGSPHDGAVLDPFAGSGTVAEVAKDHGRHSIMIELNPEYRPLIEQRLAKEKKK